MQSIKTFRPGFFSLPIFYFTLCFFFMNQFTFGQQVHHKALPSNWEFQLSPSGTNGPEAQSLSGQWFPARVPGVVHTDLLANKLIEDPFWETNEIKLKWIERENWDYRTTFEITKEDLSFQHLEMVFEGLDTYADVFINGNKIISSINMFRAWRAEIRDLLRQGQNEVLVKFRTPLIENKQKLENYPVRLPSGNETVDLQVGSFTRKAAYHFGWDWGPRFVGCGIWRPVYIEQWNEAKISDVFCRTISVDKDTAIVKIQVEVEADIPAEADYTLNFNGRKMACTLKPGDNLVVFDYQVLSPKLWWPNGLGDPYLYDLAVELTSGNKLVDRSLTHFGIRTIKLVNQADEIGTSFYFEVNGFPVFMKGANYIPQDIFLPEVTPDRYQKLIADAKGANMNMLRVWGGGIYENDLFYQLCDQNGMLVYQDFMFAGSMYPDFDDFKQNIKEEVAYNIKRLRSHPCIALWCGNNEIEVAWANWGWQKKFGYSEKDSLRIWNNYLSIFREMIPSQVGLLDPDRQYVSTSPLSNWGKPEKFNHSSMHYWGVWHGKEPFENFKTNVGRFMAEYGFQSFPSMETIRKFASDSSFHLESATMANRQKSYIGNGMIKSYTESWYGESNSFEEFVELSQKVQAEGIKTAIKAHRMNKPHCMGTLFWQLNDCWPGPSWSSMDYYGTYKPLMEEARKFYKPVIGIMDIDDKNFDITLVSDKRERVEGHIMVRLISLSDEIQQEWNVPFQLQPNEVQKVFTIKTKELLKGLKEKNVYMELDLISENNLIFNDTLYFVRPKDLGKN